jgi:hypothetical protein
MLEHITSCENIAKGRNKLKIFALVSLILGFIISCSNDFEDTWALLSSFLVIYIILFIIYWFSRTNYVIVGSPSTKMYINVLGMEREKIINFMNAIESAKHTRILRLQGGV